jgi:hypothetical protein
LRFQQWSISTLGIVSELCAGTDRLCRPAVARGVYNADFGSKQPNGSSYGASASRHYILGTFTRYFRWCFAGSNNRTVREREAAREAFVDQGNFVQGEVKAQPVARVLTSGLENTRLSLIRLITAISDDGTYQK